jgi:3-dehydroquinate synthetase
MTAREIRFGDYTYPFLYEKDFSGLTGQLHSIKGSQFILIADYGLPKWILSQCRDAFEEIGSTHILQFQSGETNKQLHTVNRLAEECVSLGADRQSIIVAVGGGVAGNIAGMVAMLLFRGIRLIHIPTTLMAASDSVLSLKQAVNLEQGKNLIGMYYAPYLVYINLSFLTALPVRDIKGGLCEVIKNLVAIKPDRISEFQNILKRDNHYDNFEWERIIDFCIEAKMSVMRDDAYEKNTGLVLEYGHTIGHALELAANGNFNHGECISFGMLCAAEISRQLGSLSFGDVQIHRDLLKMIDVAVYPRLEHVPVIKSYIEKDNKRGYRNIKPGHVGMILLDSLGQMHQEEDSYISFVSTDLILEVVYRQMKAIEKGRVGVHGG